MIVFYGAAAACVISGGLPSDIRTLASGAGRGWTLAVAALSALIAVWALICTFRAADELQRRINHQALAFAYVGTLVVSLVYGFLQQTGLRCVSWLGVCGVLVTLWSLGLILFSRRYL
jgi:hypothetical protein